jgi:hypothetical protein
MHESAPSVCSFRHNSSQLPRIPVSVGILSNAGHSQGGGKE